jgi:cytochrome P450
MSLPVETDGGGCAKSVGGLLRDFESVDFFTDASLIPDPYPYFDYLRRRCPVLPQSQQRVVAVTGHQEALAVYKDPAFSSCVSVAGPFSGLPFEPEGDDIGALIEQHRSQIPMSEHIVTQDPPDHTRTRGLLSRLLTPKRLRENEDFMWRLADQQLDEFVSRGKCEFLDDYARPFSGLVIADLLGVPVEDHEEFRAVFSGQVVGAIDDDSVTRSHNPLEWLDDKFSAHITERRREPRADVLTELAEAKYPDGSTPDIIDVVRLATFLFAAGQETTTKLLSFGIRLIAEQPELQKLLRENRDRIPVFIEETLRMESPVKSHFRMARTSTSIGEVPIPAGCTVMLLPGASNRDARKFEEPDQFRLDRPNVREHVAFGRGNHSCPGAPLARAEGRISLNRILDRMSDITISQAAHGSPDARRYTYEPTWQLRGLTELHLEFSPIQ